MSLIQQFVGALEAAQTPSDIEAVECEYLALLRNWWPEFLPLVELALSQRKRILTCRPIV